jgi:hypothetical protein
MKQVYRVCVKCRKTKPLTKESFQFQDKWFTHKCLKCIRIDNKLRDKEDRIVKKRVNNQSYKYLHVFSNEPRQYYENESEMIWIKPWKIDLQGEELRIYESLQHG